LIEHFSQEDLERFGNTLLRWECGQDVVFTEEDSRIYQATVSENKRFAQLAGFESFLDFNRARSLEKEK
jgi:hypothetical protein